MKPYLTYAVAALAGMTIFANDVAADVINVRVERRGFYPTNIYVQQGDIIRFTNESPNWVRFENTTYSNTSPNYEIRLAAAKAADLSDDGAINYSVPACDPLTMSESERWDWNINWFRINDVRELEVSLCMTTTIKAPRVNGWSYNDEQFVGNIIFGEAPNGN